MRKTLSTPSKAASKVAVSSKSKRTSSTTSSTTLLAASGLLVAPFTAIPCRIRCLATYIPTLPVTPVTNTLSNDVIMLVVPASAAE